MGRGINAQRERFLAGAVLLGAVAVFMLAMVLSHGPAPSTERFPVLEQDSSEYVLLADNLLKHGAFSDTPDLAPFRKWAIGYPLFLATSKALTGGFVLAVIIQVLLLALATVLVFRMARTLLPERFALIPALVFGLNPYVLFLNTVVLSDGLFASLLACVVYLLFFAKPKTLREFFCIGFLLGVATLIRPIAQFLVLLLPLLYFFVSRIPLKRAWRIAAAFVFGFLIIIAPWVARNHSIFGTAELAHIAQFDLLYYNAQSFLVMKELRAERPQPILLASAPLFTQDAADATKRVEDRITRDLASATPPGGNPENYYGVLGARYILSDPFYYGYFHIISTASFFLTGDIRAFEVDTRSLAVRNGYDVPVKSIFVAWNDVRNAPSTAVRLQSAGTLAVPALEIGFQIALVLLSLLALLSAKPPARNTLFVFAALIAYFALITGPIGIGTARLHIPSEPYLFLLASVGVAALIPLLQHLYAHRFEFLRFLVSGITATALQVALLFGFTEFLKVPYLVSASVAMLIAYGLSFVLQKHWSFKNSDTSKTKRQLALYAGFVSFNIALNAALLWFFVHELFLWYVFAQLVAAVAIALLSYVVYKKVLFAKPDARS